jgi:hypothetical protein
MRVGILLALIRRPEWAKVKNRLGIRQSTGDQTKFMIAHRDAMAVHEPLHFFRHEKFSLPDVGL